MKDFKIRFEKLLIDKLSVSQEDIKPEAKFTEDLGRRERVLNLTLQYAQYQLFTKTLFAKSTR